jgi:hypothetical protein
MYNDYTHPILRLKQEVKSKKILKKIVSANIIQK